MIELFANPEDDQWTVKAVHNEAEAIKLGEIGFEPFVVINGVGLGLNFNFLPSILMLENDVSILSLE